MWAVHRGVKAARATLGAMPRPPDALGAHMSIAGGLHRALERGRALDCAAVQIFLKNQRQWRTRPMTDAEVRAFHAARRQTRSEERRVGKECRCRSSTRHGKKNDGRRRK